MPRITDYEIWEKEGTLKDKLTLIRGWARNGLTDKQIAKNLGLALSTLSDYKTKYSDLSDALKKGKEVVDIEVENALYKRAIGYTYDEVTVERIFNKETNQYETRETKRVTKEVQPDVTAQIIWLKNRKKEDWRDKVEYEATKGTNTEGILTDLLEAINGKKP